MKTTINRKKRTVTVSINGEKEVMSFEEGWAFIYLFMRKLASAHRA